MKFRTLGKTGIKISEIGLGTWEISGDVYGKKDNNESIKAIHTAIELGINFIDTAAGYGKGHAEELIGKSLNQNKNLKNKIIISTKIKPKCGIFAPSPEKNIDDFYPPDYIIEQCNTSLKRLRIDQIGILFIHTWSRSWGHRTEWYETLINLKKQGKIRSFGISIPDEGIADANTHIEANRVDVIQCVYNVFQQEPEYTLFPLAKKHDVGIIARSPFSSGALIGNWTKDMKFEEGDWRGIWPKSVKKNWLEEQIEMTNYVYEVIKEEDIYLSKAAIKYILMNKSVTSVIPGSANSKHVKENTNIYKLNNLSQKTMNSLKKLWVEGKIHGTYNGSI